MYFLSFESCKFMVFPWVIIFGPFMVSKLSRRLSRLSNQPHHFRPTHHDTRSSSSPLCHNRPTLTSPFTLSAHPITTVPWWSLFTIAIRRFYYLDVITLWSGIETYSMMAIGVYGGKTTPSHTVLTIRRIYENSDNLRKACYSSH